MSQLHAVVGGNPRARFGRASPNLVCGHTHTTPDNHHQLSSAVRFAGGLKRLSDWELFSHALFFILQTATSIPLSVAPWTPSRREREDVRRWRGQRITAERRPWCWTFGLPVKCGRVRTENKRSPFDMVVWNDLLQAYRGLNQRGQGGGQ